ncbi:MAG: TlpA family protein disulfide reductase [Gammaproteobacteria bacterium]|nr:TlpA family protein disulfide reductase [Gammaproteobacteria bacterium]
MKLPISVPVLLVMLGILTWNVQAAPAGQPAPDFALPNIDGKNIRLKELRGQVVLINYWASWCGPCRQEMPLLNDIYKKYNKLGFVILGVNVEQDSNKAKGYLRDVPVSFPILYDMQNQLSKLYNINAMPTTVIVDRSGMIRYVHEGYKPGYEETYKKQIKELVKE